MKLRILILMFLLALSDKGFCASVTPPQQTEKITVSATLKSDPLNNILLGKFLVEFEETTLQQIRDFIGCESINDSGSDGGHQYWLCYSQPGQLIWFISDGEMGGSNHTLTQIIAVATNKNSQTDDQIPEIPPHAQPITSNFGWIGMAKDDLIKSIGQPSGIRNNHLIYYYSGKEPGIYNGRDMEWDITAYIEVEIENNKVTSIYASHVTSY